MTGLEVGDECSLIQSIGLGVLGAGGIGYAVVSEGRYNDLQIQNKELRQNIVNQDSRIQSLSITVGEQVSEHVNGSTDTDPNNGKNRYSPIFRYSRCSLQATHSMLIC